MPQYSTFRNIRKLYISTFSVNRLLLHTVYIAEKFNGLQNAERERKKIILFHMI